MPAPTARIYVLQLVVAMPGWSGSALATVQDSNFGLSDVERGGDQGRAVRIKRIERGGFRGFRGWQGKD